MYTGTHGSLTKTDSAPWIAPWSRPRLRYLLTRQDWNDKMQESGGTGARLDGDNRTQDKAGLGRGWTREKVVQERV